VPWGIIFPHAGDAPRHPSQLYEAALEGIVLFTIGMIAVRMGALKRPGLVGGLFVACYGLARVAGEQFREPDAQLGYLFGGLTMGTLLSLPMIIAGAIAIVCALRAAPRKA
jgi:phosphatidylglycerol:prolipoprotein diacylglycerol transferase